MRRRASLGRSASASRANDLGLSPESKALGPIAATTRVTVAVTSTSAPRTSPVIPPSRRIACRCTTRAAPRPATTASGRVQPSGSPIIVAEITTAASAAATVASVVTIGIAGRTVPATSAPSPSGLAAGTPRRQAQVRASLPVTTAAISAAGPRPGPADSAWLSAATWMSSVMMSVTVPSGPMSERRMMSSAAGAGLPLARPSARSASPSRWRPRVSRASEPTASPAAVSGPAPSG